MALLRLRADVSDDGGQERYVSTPHRIRHAFRAPIARNYRSSFPRVIVQFYEAYQIFLAILLEKLLGFYHYRA
jgi:hypothetical protein